MFQQDFHFHCDSQHPQLGAMIGQIHANPANLPQIFYRHVQPLTSVFGFRCGEASYYWKEIVPGTLLRKVKNVWRGSPAKRVLIVSKAWESLGLLTPKVVAWGEAIHHNARHFFIATTAVPESITVRNLLLDQWGREENWNPCRRALLVKLGQQIRAMHDQRWFHPDFHINNILVTPKHQPSTIYHLDLENVQQFARLPKRLKIKMLTRVNISFQPNFTIHDRLAVFRGYWPRSRKGNADRKTFMRSVIRDFQKLVWESAAKYGLPSSIGFLEAVRLISQKKMIDIVKDSG